MLAFALVFMAALAAAGVPPAVLPDLADPSRYAPAPVAMAPFPATSESRAPPHDIDDDLDGLMGLDTLIDEEGAMRVSPETFLPPRTLARDTSRPLPAGLGAAVGGVAFTMR